MIVSGLLVTLAPEANRAALHNTLMARSELSVGQIHDRWLPVALEAGDDVHSRAVHDWLMALPGVEYVDVIAVHFEPDADHPVDASFTAKSTTTPSRSPSASNPSQARP